MVHIQFNNVQFTHIGKVYLCVYSKHGILKFRVFLWITSISPAEYDTIKHSHLKASHDPKINVVWIFIKLFIFVLDTIGNHFMGK